MLIRHAQSLGNIQGLMEGQSSTPLSTAGHHQAVQLSRAICQTLIQHQPIHLYSSPLLRATQTTQAIINALQSADHPFCLQQADSLQEIHQGIFQGLSWAQAQANYPALCEQLMSALSWQPVPEAESPTAARSRAQAWVTQILQVHQPGDTVWAMSHAGILQQIVSAILGCDRTWQIPIAHTAIFEFWLAANPEPFLSDLDPDRFNLEYWQIRRFNDCSHLSIST